MQIVQELLPGGHKARVDAGNKDLVPVPIHVELLVERLHQPANAELGGAVADGAAKGYDTYE